MVFLFYREFSWGIKYLRQHFLQALWRFLPYIEFFMIFLLNIFFIFICFLFLAVNSCYIQAVNSAAVPLFFVELKSEFLILLNLSLLTEPQQFALCLLQDIIPYHSPGRNFHPFSSILIEWHSFFIIFPSSSLLLLLVLCCKFPFSNTCLVKLCFFFP